MTPCETSMDPNRPIVCGKPATVHVTARRYATDAEADSYCDRPMCADCALELAESWTLQGASVRLSAVKEESR